MVETIGRCLIWRNKRQANEKRSLTASILGIFSSANSVVLIFRELRITGETPIIKATLGLYNSPIQENYRIWQDDFAVMELFRKNNMKLMENR